MVGYPMCHLKAKVNSLHYLFFVFCITNRHNCIKRWEFFIWILKVVCRMVFSRANNVEMQRSELVKASAFFAVSSPS